MSDATPLVHALVTAGVTHVVGIPDNTSGPLFDAIERHPTVRLLTATREGEAIAIASGLWLGGASPLVVIQNTGLLESGDAIRGTAMRMAASVPMVVTGRGYAKMAAAGLTPGEPPTPEVATRADVDTVALLTEPTLEAWGVPFFRCEGDDDAVAAVVSVVEASVSEGWPAVVVMARAFD